jgi:hypothetical protein
MPLDPAHALRRIGLSLLATLSIAACGGPLRSEPHTQLDAIVKPRQAPALDGAIAAVPQAGKVTIVDVWELDCDPCLDRMRRLEALYRARVSDGLAVVGVATDVRPNEVQERVDALGVSYPNVIDRGRMFVDAFDIEEVPTVLLIDRTGTLRAVRHGGDPDDLEAAIRAAELLLEESPDWAGRAEK